MDALPACVPLGTPPGRVVFGLTSLTQMLEPFNPPGVRVT